MFILMKITGDVILFFGCVFLVMGIQFIASDPHLQAELTELLKTGVLPMSPKLLAGSAGVFGGVITIGFGQIVYALAAMAERMVRRRP